MPAICIVVGCGSRSNRDKVSFYSVPAETKHRFLTEKNDLSKLRRASWIAAIKRNDLTESILKHQKVCSKHFITGKPTALEDKHHPDWVPSQYMGQVFQNVRKREADVDRKDRLAKRRKLTNNQDYHITASEYYKCKTELSTTAIHDILDGVVKEEAPEITQFGKYGNEQYASGNHFGTMKREIAEEDPIKTKPFSEYGVFNEFLGKNENERFYDPDSSEFHITHRNSVEDLKESKLSLTNLWENTDFNVFAGELAKPKVNHFDNGVLLKYEDEGHNSKCTENSQTISTELKTETFKDENDIDIIYEDVKPKISEKKSSGKSEEESYLKPFTDISIGANHSPEFS